MEQVFDFREFIVNIFKRYKLVLVPALIFCLLGSLFGLYKASGEHYMTTYTANVNMTSANTEADVLTGTMKNITAIIESDYFYNNIVDEIKKEMTNGEFSEIFSDDKEPSISKIKEVIVLHTKGNLILLDITSERPELTKEACEIGINYIVREIPSMINNISVSSLGSQTVDISEQKGETVGKDVALFGILGLVGGIAIGVLFIFFSEVLI